MTIREVHGIAAGSPGTGRYMQTIQIIDGVDPGTVVVAMSEVTPATITADEARFLADLLNEAANRVDRGASTFIATDPEGVPAAGPLEPLPSLIAVRNPKPPKVWTVERNEIMRREVPLGRLTREELKAALEELPGPPIPNLGRLGTQAHTLGLRWGTPPQAATAAPEAAQELVSEPVQEPQEVPNGAAPGVSAVPGDFRPLPAVRPQFDRQETPMAMDFDQVKQLSSRWGVDFMTWDDLPMVNAKAERLGHPRIERRYALPRKLHNLDAD